MAMMMSATQQGIALTMSWVDIVSDDFSHD
jgi:hypothetical protein